MAEASSMDKSFFTFHSSISDFVLSAGVFASARDLSIVKL
jgi:hypothetical protein